MHAVFKWLKVVPSLLYIFIIYIIILVISGSERMEVVMHHTLFILPLVSGELSMRTGDILVMLGVIALFAELMKATAATNVTVVEHALSVLSFMAFLLVLLLVQGAATATFLLLTLLQLLDVIAGFSISISVARRDFMVNH